MPSVIQSRKSSAWRDRHRRLAAPELRPRHEAAPIEPAEQDAGHIGEAIPADGDRPDCDRDGIDDRVGDDQEVPWGSAAALVAGRPATLHRRPRPLSRRRSAAPLGGRRLAPHSAVSRPIVWSHDANHRPVLRRVGQAHHRCRGRRRRRAQGDRKRGARPGRARACATSTWCSARSSRRSRPWRRRRARRTSSSEASASPRSKPPSSRAWPTRANRRHLQIAEKKLFRPVDFGRPPFDVWVERASVAGCRGSATEGDTDLCVS